MSDGGGHRGTELACVPAATDAVAAAAALAGLRALDVPDVATLAARLAEPPREVAAVVVDASGGALGDALLWCKALRRLDPPYSPILLLVALERLDDLSMRDDLFDDFAVAPATSRELAMRLRHLLVGTGAGVATALLERGPLAINVATYQATIAGRALDLTYMEYELLRFFASHPEQVVTRETLLSRVWGYEYYGGARTVDVHVRRLRAKLGEEHAHLIQTVRGVGYRFA